MKKQKEKQSELFPEGTYKVIKEIERLTTTQEWSAYNQAQTNERIISEKLLLELLDFIQPEDETKIGYSTKEKIYCMFVYNYTKQSSRRCISELRMAEERKALPKTPHFNSVLNFFAYPEMTPLLQKLILITALPLKNVEKDFAIDSSGFSTSLYERWVDVKLNKVRSLRHWKKCHIMVGVKTNVITSVKVTESNRSDTLEYIPLARKTNGFFDIREISADKAYLGVANMEETASMGAIPYIPFKVNSREKHASGSVIWSRMFDYFLKNHNRYLASYHKRSNVETTFSMIKRKFGQNLRTKRDISHVNEILMKCLCHNLAVLVQESSELGLEVDLGRCVKAAQKE